MGQEWVTAAVSDEEGTVDIVAEAAAILAEHGHQTVRHDNELYLEANNLTFSVRGLEIIAQPNGVRTVSGIVAAHPAAFPEGIVEYQHGMGDNLRAAVRFGLSQWVQLDVPVLCDATVDEPSCMSMVMTFPAEGDRPKRVRRVILGPTAHFVTQPPDAPEACGADGEEHPFCPCCMVTNSGEAFKPLFELDDTLALRLFAARSAEGEFLADCRVNGEDYELGKEALRTYASTWPETGVEFRKQYVLMQTRAAE